MALSEIRRRYKRTTLGPFWSAASLSIFVGTFGLLYALLWKLDYQSFIPYLTSGMICWVFFNALIMEGAGGLVSFEAIMKQMRVPYVMVILLVSARNMFVFLHHLVIYLVVVLAFSVPINVNTLLFVPGLFLFLCATSSISLCAAIACARYRDIQQVLQSVLQVAMFVTPILYPKSLLGDHGSLIADLNPIYHLVNIVRAPLMGEIPSTMNYLVVSGLAVAFGAISFVTLMRVRRRLIHWL